MAANPNYGSAMYSAAPVALAGPGAAVAAPAPVPDPSAAGLPLVTTTFGILVGGRPVSTDFQEVVPGARYTAFVARPSEAEYVSLFLLPGMAFPPDKGITIMYAFAPFEDWTTLGVLTPDRPSGTFRTGWPALPSLSPAEHPYAMIGLAVEPLDAVSSVGQALASAEYDKLGFAELVAGDLVRFLSSFAQSTPGGERIVLPPTAIDRWKERFTDKFRREGPGFLYKKASTSA